MNRRAAEKPKVFSVEVILASEDESLAAAAAFGAA
jgi:hypothetical protein